MMTVMIIAILAALGLIFGSFVNAMVWRLHEQAADSRSKSKTKKQKHLTSDELSITKGRSMCSRCHHSLSALDLIPVISWLMLGGKCRYCRQPIADNPLVELTLPLLFVWSYLAWPYDLSGSWHIGLFVVWLAIVVLYTALTVYDSRWFLLPNRLVFPLVGLAAVFSVLRIGSVEGYGVLGLLLGVVVIAGLFWGLYQYSDGRWIGGGDVKLALALGMIAGTPLQAGLVIFTASLLGTIGSVPLLLRGRQGMKQQIPFGPYLLAGSGVVLLYGDRLIDHYQRLFL